MVKLYNNRDAKSSIFCNLILRHIDVHELLLYNMNMNKIKLTQIDREYMSKVYQLIRKENDIIRERLIDEVRAIKDPEAKLDRVLEIFMGYDYDYGRVFKKVPETREFKLNGIKYECLGFTNTNYEDSPSVHLTKLAQCTTFAHEVSILLCSNGLDCIIDRSIEPCFNMFTGQLEEIGHQYNMITLPSGKLRRLDVTANIMRRDARRLGAKIDEDALMGKK